MTTPDLFSFLINLVGILPNGINSALVLRKLVRRVKGPVQGDPTVVAMEESGGGWRVGHLMDVTSEPTTTERRCCGQGVPVP